MMDQADSGTQSSRLSIQFPRLRELIPSSDYISKTTVYDTTAKRPIYLRSLAQNDVLKLVLKTKFHYHKCLRVMRQWS